MICSEAQAALLEADLPVMRGEGDAPLAVHIRSCSRCRMMASVILDGEAGLARSLASALPPLDLDEILERAKDTKDTEVLSIPPSRPLRARWGIAKTLVPLAAAAALTALFLGRPPSLPGPVYTPATAGVGLEVEVPQGRSIAVLETNNPEITVLWVF